MRRLPCLSNPSILSSLLKSFCLQIDQPPGSLDEPSERCPSVPERLAQYVKMEARRKRDPLHLAAYEAVHSESREPAQILMKHLRALHPSGVRQMASYPEMVVEIHTLPVERPPPGGKQLEVRARARREAKLVAHAPVQNCVTKGTNIGDDHQQKHCQ